MEQKTTRPTLEETYLKMAQVIGTRSTCRHRDQGAILVINNHVVSVGYNGAAPGQPHCIDKGYCIKAEGLPCRAEGLHAESNALAFAAKLGISISGSTLYSVYSAHFVFNIHNIAVDFFQLFQNSFVLPL